MKRTRDRTVRPRVLTAIDAGCNTSMDVAEETGLSKIQASYCLKSLAQDGIVKRTDRVIVLGHRRRYRVFEVAS